MGGFFRLRAWMALVTLAGAALAAEPSGKWTTSEKDSRVEAHYEGALVLGWQSAPLANPVGGERFAGSAFLHPLRTPAGFEWTAIQPDDHKHHFGLWWPWKFVEVEGKAYNTWEIQDGQGGHVAESVRALPAASGSPSWEFGNKTFIKGPGRSPVAVIQETSRVGVAVMGDAQVLDISLQQKPVGSPVRILPHRYSGFSWRGPASWNKDNSTMTTSAGKGREDANGTEARWVMVTGPTSHGSATVLLMSAAKTTEKLRVWDSKAQNGAPFVNFNPVMDKPLPLDDAHPEVSRRSYRVIAADHTISAAEAEARWRKWTGK